MLAQRILGAVLIAISIFAIAAEAGTVMIITLPLGVIALFSKKNILNI